MQYHHSKSKFRTRLLSLGATLAAMIGFAAEAQAEDRYIVDTPNGRMACLWANGTYSDCQAVAAVEQTPTAAANTAADDEDDVEVVIENTYTDDSTAADANNNTSATIATDDVASAQQDKIDTASDAQNTTVADSASDNIDTASITNSTVDESTSNASENAALADSNYDANSDSYYAETTDVNDSDNYMWSEESWSEPPVNGPDVVATQTSTKKVVTSTVKPASSYNSQAIYNSTPNYNADVFDDSFYIEFGAGWGALFDDSNMYNGATLNINFGYKWETFSLGLDNDILFTIPTEEGFFDHDPNDEMISYNLTALLGLNFFPSSNFHIKLGVGPTLNYLASDDLDGESSHSEGVHLAAKAKLGFHYVEDNGFLVGVDAFWIPTFDSDGIAENVAGVSLVLGYL